MSDFTDADWARIHPETIRPDDERSQAEIDRSRIIHCAAFRRLQGKTQIFGVAHDDFFRTRLTHSLEVAQIAKGIALLVGANAELVEAISLAHDIGHPPFGHAGERTLDDCMRAGGFGRFESNAQNLRTLSYLEVKKVSYHGLNLTRATLDGLLKHKLVPGAASAPVAYDDERALVDWITADAPPNEISLEAQIVDWADQVAYSVHDLEDGIHAGMITSARLNDPYLKEQITQEIAAEYAPEQMQGTFEWLFGQVRRMEEMHDARQRSAERKQLTSSLIHRFVMATRAKPRKREVDMIVPGRYAQHLIVTKKEFGRATVLKAIARKLIVHDQRVATLERRTTFVLRRLFGELTQPDSLDLYPEEYRPFFAAAQDAAQRARVACDYIAGMTDNYAEMLYHRLFSPGTGSIFEPL